MEKIAQLKHRSLTDWDFQVDSLLELNAAHYVSEPSSLAVPRQWTGYWEWLWAYLKASIDNCIPHGLLATWLWMEREGTNTPWFWVRAQAVPPAGAGFVKPANGYAFHFTTAYVRIIRRVNNSETVLVTEDLANQLPARQWNHIAMFWETLDLGAGDFLRLTFQVEVDGAWVTQATYDDTQDLWAGSSVNKVGFNLAGSFIREDEAYKSRVDDTEIWRRIA